MHNAETDFSHSTEEFTEDEAEKEVILSIDEEEKDVIRSCITSLSQSEGQRDAALQQLRKIWDAYLEHPTLLDPCFEEWVHLLTRFQNCESDVSIVETTPASLFHSDLRYRLSALYTLSKVRGRKRLQRFLPHSANVVEPVWIALQNSLQFSQSEDDSSTTNQLPPLWESTYVLWIWMTACSYVPLDAHLLVASQEHFLSSLMDTAAAAPPGPLQSVASACAAAWLARPDAAPQRHRFTNLVLQSSEGMNHGRLQTLVTLLKGSSAPRETLLQEQILPLWESIRSWSQTQQNDWLLQKLLLKWWTRSACAFLPSVEDGRSLRDRIRSSLDHSTNATTTLAAAACSDTFPWLDPVEYALGRTLEALTHTSTLVRVAAAKGVGRITERLPALCWEDVVDALLLLLHHETAEEARDRAWHGACLALAELARRGLLSDLNAVLPLLIQAVQYDPRRGARGAAVRDAACYTYWALVRAYPLEILQRYEHMQELREAVLLMSLFDREVNGRRAASAAFQEAVGRQGARHVPHGLQIMSLANYYSLGNRTHAYLTIAVELAQHDALRRPILRHLYMTQLLHWDIHIRTLSSQSLYRLTPLDPTFMSQVVMPKLLDQCLDEHDLCTRHGAVLGVAEIIRGLGSVHSLPPQTLQKLVNLVSTMEQKRLYRGRGGEVMRSGVCRLIECMCIAHVPLTVPEQVRFLDSIDANLPHPMESIQEQACRALQTLMTFYFPVGATGPSERLQKRVLYKFMDRIQTDENPAVTQGYALALGYLPDKLVGTSQKTLQMIVDCLIRAAHYSSCVGTERDAATRKNALSSLLRISRTLGWEGLGTTSNESKYPVVQCSQGIFSQLCAAFFAAMDDYNTDRRGDVGSWCRLVGIQNLTELMLVVSQCHTTQDWISEALWTSTVSTLMKQCAEKLDSVRQCAGASLEQLLRVPYLADLAHSAALIQTLQLPPSLSKDLPPRWFCDIAHAFPMVMAVASIHNALMDAIMRGIVASVGGLSEDVRQSSSSALLSWAKRASPAQRGELSLLLLRLLEENVKNARLVQPTLKTIDVLITHGCLDAVIQSSHWTMQCLPWLERIALFHNTNVSSLGTLVDVTVSLLAAHPGDAAEVTAALAFLCRRLTHPFPRVRSYTAQQFYVYLSLDENYENDEEEKDERIAAVQALVSTTPWTQELPKHELHRVPTSIATELGILEAFQQKPPTPQIPV